MLRWLIIMALVLAACGSRSTEAVTAQDVIDAFQAAGLEAESAHPMTPDDYGAAPMTATEGVRFLIPSLGADKGGRVLIFDNDDELAATRTYYEELGRQSALFFSWVFVNGRALVQITGDLPEETARQYETALASVGD